MDRVAAVPRASNSMNWPTDGPRSGPTSISMSTFSPIYFRAQGAQHEISQRIDLTLDVDQTHVARRGILDPQRRVRCRAVSIKCNSLDLKQRQWLNDLDEDHCRDVGRKGS